MIKTFEPNLMFRTSKQEISFVFVTTIIQFKDQQTKFYNVL